MVKAVPAPRRHYEQAFNDFLERPESSDRDLIASILLDAVEQSFQCDQEARHWLGGIYAQSLLMLLDINPEAALEHLNFKWARIDRRLQ
ncbi:hypothetical protein BBC27_08045 [Acidithiobacillus ferrivorans]|uniref:Uncharacterized protein n=2 Tax=Acidithiobacillus ferrivorans TaxID=160808 RepID=A0A1B9C0D6_9PROT|nr:hypothetical protein BBC27_08045 [Acidithiobacillus ferrivorans]